MQQIWGNTLPPVPGAPVTAPPAPPPPSGATLTTFQLVSPNTGLAEFSLAVPLKKGATAGPGISTSVAASQCIIKRTWNDSSVKHVLIDGVASLTANTPLTVQVIDSAGAGGTNLTAANIAASTAFSVAGQNVVNLGVNGSVDLSTLLGSPVRTWKSGPQAVECHYQSVIAGILVSFHVRLYSTGKARIFCSVDNGWVDISNSDKIYTPSVTIGGTLVYNPGTNITHYMHTRWFAQGWIGGDPQVTPKHTVADLINTKLVPNYFMDTPPSTVLNAQTQTYTQMGAADIHHAMGDTGFQNQIGILPVWDALYITSLADPRAFNAMVANELSMNSFALTWRSSIDNLPLRPSQFPTFAYDGNAGQNAAAGVGGAGIQSPGTGAGLVWDQAHHPSAGYIGYMVTGEYVHLETMQLQSGLVWLVVSTGNGSGVNRDLKNGALRQVGWSNRTIAQLNAISPAGDLVLADFQPLQFNNATINASLITGTAGINHLGLFYDFDAWASPVTPASLSPTFMFTFQVQGIGHGSDLEPLSDANMVTFNNVRDHLYEIPVGLLGSASGTDYCFAWSMSDFRLSAYSVQPTDGAQAIVSPPTDDTWGAIWSRPQISHTQPGTVCDNTLHGTSGSGSDPSAGATSFWANMMPAIALAVDHGAAGAQAAWNRLTGASNWLTVRNAVSPNDFASVPMFGIQPRDRFSAQLDVLTSGQWSPNLVSTMGGRHYTDAPFVALGAANFNSYYGHNGHIPATTNGNPWAFSSGCFLSDKNKYAFTGGGHTDWLGTEVQLFDFPTLSWQFTDDSCQYDSVADPSAIFTIGGTPTELPWPNKNGRRTPISCHMYGGMAYCQSLGLIEVMGTFRFPDAGGGTGGAAYILPNTGQWESPAAHASVFTTISQSFAIWIPDCKPAGGGATVGRVFRMGNQGGSNPIAYLHDPVTGTWEQAGNFVSAFPADNFIGSGCLIPDPLNAGFRAYIAVANASPTTQCFLAQKVDVTGANPNLGFVYHAFGNTGPVLSAEVAFIAMRADRGTSQIVVWDATAPLQFYILDDTTLMWTGPFSLTGTAPDTTGEAAGNNVYKNFHYHPAYDSFCFFSRITKGDLFAFKRPSQVT